MKKTKTNHPRYPYVNETLLDFVQNIGRNQSLRVLEKDIGLQHAVEEQLQRVLMRRIDAARKVKRVGLDPRSKQVQHTNA
jgi:hypothetical protein